MIGDSIMGSEFFGATQAIKVGLVQQRLTKFPSGFPWEISLRESAVRYVPEITAVGKVIEWPSKSRTAVRTQKNPLPGGSG